MTKNLSESLLSYQIPKKHPYQQKWEKTAPIKAKATKIPHQPHTTDSVEVLRRAESSSWPRLEPWCGEVTNSLSVVSSMIQQEESRCYVMNGPEVLGGKGHEQLCSRQNPSSKIEIKKCTNCKKEGHIVDRRWFLYSHLRPKREMAAEKGGGRWNRIEEKRNG